MGVLPDWVIKETQIIKNPEDRKDSGVISYGFTSYGYDARCGYKFKVFTNNHNATVDPKNFNPKTFIDIELDPNDKKNNSIIIPPNSFALAETIEEFTIPRDMIGVCVGKSTYARCGIIINVTPLEPEWRGIVTVEISNSTPCPARIYAGEGIMQVMFIRADTFRFTKALISTIYHDLLEGDQFNLKKLKASETALQQLLTSGECHFSYADKKGKYQDQKGLTLPLIKE